MKHILYLLLLTVALGSQAQRKVFLTSAAPTFPIEDTRFFSKPDTAFYIFLAFGQSNMVGDATPENQDYTGIDSRFLMMPAIDQPAQTGNNRGAERKRYNWYIARPPFNSQGAGLSPCDYFGRTLVAGLPQRNRVGIINVAVGGCRIEHFFKEFNPTELKRTGYSEWFVNHMARYDSIQYIRLLDCALRAQHYGVIKGILLHQGESNVGDKQWPIKVKKVYEDLLHDLNLNAKDVPLLAGEVVHEQQNGKSSRANELVDILPKYIPTAHVIPSAGCEANPADTNHFNAAGYRELGRRYGKKMLELLGY